jgi:response regulator RpfG family c-di-GMP phosphodiesterase
MALKKKHVIMCVDDEPSILKSLNRLFRREGFRVITANSGKEGLSLLSRLDTPVSLIISDQRMPEMTGSQFLEKSKTFCPDAIRFLLTGYADMDAIVDAINKGEVSRYLSKPWNDSDLLLQIRIALEQVELQQENRALTETTQRQNRKLLELSMNLDRKVKEKTQEVIQKNKALEDSFQQILQLLSSLITGANRKLGMHLQRTTTFARAIAEALELSPRDVEEIESAALLHDIGLLGLDDDFLWMDECQLSKSQLKLFSQHPTTAEVCLQSVPRLDNIATIIGAHHEHFNGNGFPRGLKLDEIPLGARIIGAASDYCRIQTIWPDDVNEIIRIARWYFGSESKNMLLTDRDTMVADITFKIFMNRSGSRYDPQVAQLIIQRMKSDFKSDKVTEFQADKVELVHHHNLQAGMCLASTLFTHDGRTVLPSGAVLNTSMVKGLQKLATGQAINEDILVLQASTQPSTRK